MRNPAYFEYGFALGLFDSRWNDGAAGSCTRTLSIYFGGARVDFGVAGSIGLAGRPERKDVLLSSCRKIVTHISFFDEAHGSSSRPVAYLERCSSGAKQWRLKARAKILTKHTPQIVAVPCVKSASSRVSLYPSHAIHSRNPQILGRPFPLASYNRSRGQKARLPSHPGLFYL